MTRKMKAISVCRDLIRQRDAMTTLEGHEYGQRRLDTAVQDVIAINKWYRGAARSRLKQMRAA